MPVIIKTVIKPTSTSTFLKNDFRLCQSNKWVKIRPNSVVNIRQSVSKGRVEGITNYYVIIKMLRNDQILLFPLQMILHVIQQLMIMKI